MFFYCLLSTALDLSCLSQRFVEDDGDRCGEIETAHVWIEHRDGQAPLPVCAQDVFGQAARLTPKDQTIVRLKTPGRVRLFGLGREIDEPRFRQRGLKRGEIAM